jgi:hypothetical protein
MIIGKQKTMICTHGSIRLYLPTTLRDLQLLHKTASENQKSPGRLITIENECQFYSVND